jgi:hypothetical protein
MTKQGAHTRVVMEQRHFNDCSRRTLISKLTGEFKNRNIMQRARIQRTYITFFKAGAKVSVFWSLKVHK